MRSKIIINLNNLKENYLTIKSKVKKDIIAVLKDNAYGHDLIMCAKTLSSINVKMIAVATLEEAIYLRKNLIFTPILLFERVKNYRLLSSYHIISSVQSLEHLKELCGVKIPLSIHLEIETGFHRFGIKEEDIDEAIQLINHSSLSLKGIFTHYSDSKNYESQKEIFINVLKKFKNFKNLMIHTSSSAYFLKDENFTNAIRIGISLYGINKELKLKPVMSIFSYVLRCDVIKKGEYVSYHMKEKAESDGYILTLGMGYGDGWHKDYLTLGYGEKYYHQIGVTNMDALMLFSPNKVKELSLIELLGEHITIEDICSTYQIDPYDFYTSLNIRIPREFV